MNGTAPHDRRHASRRTTVVRLRFPASNAYLLLGERPVLVDAGNIGDGDRLDRALARHGLRWPDLALLVLTHAHGDHFGDAPARRGRSGPPIALHRADLPLARLGREPELRPTGPAGRLLKPFFRYRFEPFEPDLVLDGPLDLAPWGVAGRVLHTPGHTPGSASVLLDGGDVVLGDLLRGSFLRRDAPAPHFFDDDPAASRASLARLLREEDVRRVLLGHGEPLSGAALRAHLARRSG